MVHEKVDSSLNFVDREKDVLDFWKRERIFEKSMELREGNPVFTFYDGPPTANGKPHVGHLLTRSIKDLIPRYRTMKGDWVLRKAGWDTHGLPVELEVEKLLGLDGKPQIEEYGVAPFIDECRKSVWKYKEEWERISDRVGYWADMENPYITYDNKYIESVWWSLKQVHEKGLLYHGHKVVPYCPRCGTALSSHEVAQGYKDVTETSVFVRFKMRGEANTYLLAWTTTPWTLPSNVALVVNAKEEYVRAAWQGDTYILAGALVETVLGEGAEVLARFPGETLRGVEYEPLYNFVQTAKRGWYVVCDDYVTLTDGTGIVHTAPAFGEDDARVGRDNDLPFVQLVNAQGCFDERAEPFKGLFAKEADPKIIDDLRARGLLFKTQEYTHSYPYCWRCDTPLLYYARATWFIRMTEVRDRLLKNNRAINWIPENIKEGRMGNFLENVVDWGLSRERYWGTPLPVWECECGHVEVIGSVAELREKGENLPEPLELHKPYMDQVTIKCPKCGRTVHRVPEVIDCWYDSGSMPFAQWHYPFENKEKFEQNFPADFISEAIDQTRGWFYVLLAIGTLIFDRAPFENCIVMGHVNDRDGLKMSKHKGNVVDPWTVLDKQGADAVRWYFYSGSAPWLPSRFYEEAVNEAQRRYMGTLWNTYAFYVLYANIDGFNAAEHALKPENLTVMDRFILSRLNTLVRQVDDDLAHYRITEPARAMAGFVDELSNWYVRRCRDRFWGSELTADKEAAYMTLYTVLVTLTKLTAPFTPFLAETLYQNLVKRLDPAAPQSVHLLDFPAWDGALIDPALEADMARTLDIVVLGRACRNAAAIKNRQPVAAFYVQGEPLPEAFQGIIRDELNAKEVRFNADAGSFVDYKLKPQLKVLGPRFGKRVPLIGKALAATDGAAAVAAWQAGQRFVLDVEGEAIALAQEDVLIETAQKEGFMTQQDKGVTVALDTNLSEALLREGLFRELVSKVQTMRKEAGFEVTDHIRLQVTGGDALLGVVAEYGEQLCRETLADELGSAQGYCKQWKLNGLDATITVEKI